MKIRLDNLLINKGLVETVTKGQALIMAGEIYVDGKIVDKPGTLVFDKSELYLKPPSLYVSRGALKIEKAYQEFSLDFKDKIFCDIGSSTGGFTDFSLQHGARLVFAIDVGHGQLDQKLRIDSRVIVMERTDFRHVEKLPEKIDYFLCDVSFLSLTKILPYINKLSDYSTYVIALIKPQFEASDKEVSRGKGVIRSVETRQEITDKMKRFAAEIGFEVLGLLESPIKGAKGNVEYLIYLFKP